MDYFAFSVAFIILMHLVEAYIQMRQHAMYYIKSPPNNIAEFVTEKEFQLTQEYNKEKSFFSFFKSAFELGVTLFFVFNLPVFFSRAKEAALLLFSPSSAFHRHDIAASVAFVSGYVVTDEVLGLPFSLYSNFVIEQRHGFNKYTMRLFLADTAKTLLLKLGFLIPIVVVYIALVAWMGAAFPLVVWLFLLVVKLLILTIFPIYIQPCFNKVEDLPAGSLKEKIESLSAKVGFPLKRIYTIDGSKRSSHSNAYMYGFCKNKRIVLFDTLLTQCTEEQIVAVLAHELGHWNMSHVLKMLFMGEVFSMTTFLLMRIFLFSENLYSSFGFDKISIFVGTILFFIVYGPIEHLKSLLVNYITRNMEFSADNYAVNLGFAKELKDGLLSLEKENKIGFVNDRIYSIYHHNHPPIIERIESIQERLD